MRLIIKLILGKYQEFNNTTKLILLYGSNILFHYSLKILLERYLLVPLIKLILRLRAYLNNVSTKNLDKNNYSQVIQLILQIYHLIVRIFYYVECLLTIVLLNIQKPILVYFLLSILEEDFQIQYLIHGILPSMIMKNTLYKRYLYYKLLPNIKRIFLQLTMILFALKAIKNYSIWTKGIPDGRYFEFLLQSILSLLWNDLLVQPKYKKKNAILRPDFVLVNNVRNIIVDAKDIRNQKSLILTYKEMCNRDYGRLLGYRYFPVTFCVLPIRFKPYNTINDLNNLWTNNNVYFIQVQNLWLLTLVNYVILIWDKSIFFILVSFGLRFIYS